MRYLEVIYYRYIKILLNILRCGVVKMASVGGRVKSSRTCAIMEFLDSTIF
jgi:hypothetical protein